MIFLSWGVTSTKLEEKKIMRLMRSFPGDRCVDMAKYKKSKLRSKTMISKYHLSQSLQNWSHLHHNKNNEMKTNGEIENCEYILGVGWGWNSFIFRYLKKIMKIRFLYKCFPSSANYLWGLGEQWRGWGGGSGRPSWSGFTSGRKSWFPSRGKSWFTSGRKSWFFEKSWFPSGRKSHVQQWLPSHFPVSYNL